MTKDEKKAEEKKADIRREEEKLKRTREFWNNWAAQRKNIIW